MALVVERSVLADIEDHDPDSWEHRQPTDFDYIQFDNYVIREYGGGVLDAYLNGRLKSK